MSELQVPLRAWHGDPALKDKIVLRMKEHRAADEFMQGVYQGYFNPTPDRLGSSKSRLTPTQVIGPDTVFRGCAIGCMVDAEPIDRTMSMPWHELVQYQFGIPTKIAHWIDRVFEGQPSFEEAGEFAVAAVEAIPVGADLSAVPIRYDWWLSAITVGDVPAVKIAGDTGQFLRDLAGAPVPE